MNNERGSNTESRSHEEQPRIVRIEIVPAEEANSQTYLLTRVGGKRRQRLLDGIGGGDAAAEEPQVRKFDPQRAVAPLLRSLETAHQLVDFMRREDAAGETARHEGLRAEVRKCVLEATSVRDGLADYLAALKNRGNSSAA